MAPGILSDSVHIHNGLKHPVVILVCLFELQHVQDP